MGVAKLGRLWTARIDLEKLWFEVLTLHQIDVHALPGKVLFSESDADLLGANRYVVVIEDEHRALTFPNPLNIRLQFYDTRYKT